MNSRGFSLIEIVVALAVFLITTVSVLSFYDKTFSNAESVVFKPLQLLPQALSEYSYEKKVCPENSLNNEVKEISLSSYISTSTRLTGIFINNNRQLIITTDSASTTEADVFIFDIDESYNLFLVSKLDVGPGITSARYISDILYVLNTSVSSHIKSFKISQNSIQQISSLKIPSLATSYSLPKTILVRQGKIFIGSEKNSGGGELFILSFDFKTGVITSIDREIEIGGQVNAIENYGSYMVVATAGDPELRIFDEQGVLVSSYDADLALGNGKSVFTLYPYMVLGRTIGSGELHVFNFKNSSTTELLSTDRLHGTADAMVKTDLDNIFVFTSNTEKELQVWSYKDINKTGILHHKSDIDLPNRISAFTCDVSHLYIALTQNDLPYVYIK